MQHLSTRCQQIFLNAANATSRGAAVVNSLGQLVQESGVDGSSQYPVFIREHTVDDISQVRLSIYLPETPPYFLQDKYTLFLCNIWESRNLMVIDRSICVLGA